MQELCKVWTVNIFKEAVILRGMKRLKWWPKRWHIWTEPLWNPLWNNEPLSTNLADEYADELNTLGVRVSNLENRVGNVKLTGDTRIRYRYQKDGKENDSSWDYRVRLCADAKVNDSTSVSYGLSTDSVSFANDNAANSDGNIFTDQAKVDTKFSNLTASVGRTDKYVLGNAYGLNYGDVFDRAELKYSTDHLAITAGYEKFKMNGNDKSFAGNDTAGIDGVKTGYGELEGFFGKNAAVGVYYNDFTRAGGSNASDTFRADDLWGLMRVSILALNGISWQTMKKSAIIPMMTPISG